jgi:ABC-type uncharacterized transport system substrate-binding protein
MPQAKKVAMLAGAHYQSTDGMVKNARAAAGALGCTLHVVVADSEQELDAAFASVVRQHASATFVAPNPFFFRQRERIVALAARHAIPALYVRREFAEAGGLASYGTSLSDTYRTGRGLRRTDSWRREAGRPADRAADEIRARHQPQDRQNARPHCAADAARHR